ncbi:TetR-like C-terminal domain-containing protein [Saccharopolyspora spinosporotrichia]
MVSARDPGHRQPAPGRPRPAARGQRRAGPHGDAHAYPAGGLLPRDRHQLQRPAQPPPPRGRETPFAQLVDSAVERGELAEVPRPERVVNLPFDLLRHDLLMGTGAVPDETIVEIVDAVWLPLLDLTLHGTQPRR